MPVRDLRRGAFCRSRASGWISQQGVFRAPWSHSKPDASQAYRIAPDVPCSEALEASGWMPQI